MSMDERVKQILESVDALRQAHDTWENDQDGPVYLTAPVEEAADMAVYTCENGDIPSQCRDLCTAMGRFAIEWGDYKSGVKRTPDHRPLGSFWAAYSAVVLARSHADEIVIKRPEPVAMLLEQRVSDNQIGRQIWGGFNKRTNKWEGPFVSPDGQVDSLKLREEAAKPGMHTSGWIHPEQRERMAERQRLLQHTLGTLKSREEADTRTVEKASIEELLKEGQYPDVIARVKGVSVAEVMEAASKAGLVPSVRPNLAAERAPQEPPVFGQEEPMSFAAAVDTNLEVTETDETDTELEIATRPSVEEFIRSVAEGRGKPEILQECKRAGYADVTFKTIDGALKPAKSGK